MQYLPHSKQELWDLVISGEVKPYGRSIIEIVAELSSPIPLAYIDWKPVYEKRVLKDHVPYLGHDTITLILNYVAPGWSSEITENQIGDRAVIACKLSIRAAEGIIVRSATGNDDLSDITYGGAVCDSEAMAFRRAAKHFGLGLALWDKEYVKRLKKIKKSGVHTNTSQVSQYNTTGQAPASLTATDNTNSSQLVNRLRNLAKEKGMVNWVKGYIQQEFQVQKADELPDEVLKKLIHQLENIMPVE